MRMHLEAPPPSPPATATASEADEAARIEDEIAVLEARLQAARQRLDGARAATTGTGSSPFPASASSSSPSRTAAATAVAAPAPGLARPPTRPGGTSAWPAAAAAAEDDDATAQQHFLLLLADSALPLGSFAFSSGLESYLAHQRERRGGAAASAASSFARDFLPLSLASYAAATLPFVLAAHRDPAAVAALDDTLDAAVVCPVGRRASVAQGRALLGIWERSLKDTVPGLADEGGDGTTRAAAAATFKTLLRLSASSSSSSTTTTTTTTTTSTTPEADGDGGDDDYDGTTGALPPPFAGHLPPLFGAVARLLGLPARQAAHVFLLGHAKALASAGVRAGVLGPYQAQRVLAAPATRRQLAALVDAAWAVPVERAGQPVPALDLWAGRHELLYSRIFNS